MVHELGHVCDQFAQFKNNNLVRDRQIEGGFASNSHKKQRCGIDNVNKFIGNIAKEYMETTEGENWASDLVNHLNSRFPTSINASKGLKNANLNKIVSHRLTSSNSSLPDLVPPVFHNPSSCQNYMNLGYNSYNSASVNVYNPGFCGGSTTVSYGGMNLISQSSAKKTDIEIITSPEQVSSVTACSYGDMISDTEAFDSRTAQNHKVGQCFSIGKKRTVYNMDVPLSLMDDVQSPFSNSCKTQQNFKKRLESGDILPSKRVSFESSSRISSYQIISSYVMYKDMPVDLRREVSFKDYMHATVCADGLCNCQLYIELASHFDKCNDSNCNTCGPARSLCGTDNLHSESRKRKHDPSEASGTLLDTLPTKCIKMESSTVGDRFSQEYDTGNDQKNINDACDERESIGLKESNNVINDEIKKLPQISSVHISLNEPPLDSRKSDNDAQLEPEKIKIQSVSLADFFTADQIREHLLSFTAPKKQDIPGNTAHSIGQNTCHLCSMDKLVFAPAPIYCSSCDIRIKRNVGYYRSANEMGIRHCFCMSCYRGSHGINIITRGFSIPKANLHKAKNDEEKEDSWVLCDRCQCWQHRICGLYNDERDVEGKAEYICPKCYLEEIESGVRVPLPQIASGAKDLPRTSLSDHIEERLERRLKEEREEMAKVSGMAPDEVPGAEGLVVRVVVSVEKHLEVKQQFIDILHGEDYPSEFVYRSKLIFLFQKIEGVDVCLFGMCVQEFGSECGGPNHRCVYISYLDSVKYFRPERKSVTGESLRTFVYHEILIGYLEYCKKRGFAMCYIWACPLIKGEDYIFYCHPETQKTPKQDKLRQWYKLMLKKAAEGDVVVGHTNLYNWFFVPSGQGNTKITAARLPYFEGDYWSGAAENIVRKLEVEEKGSGGLQSKLPNRRTLKSMGQDKLEIAVKDVLVMQKLGQTILPVKENFMIVHLQYICTHCHEVILSGSMWFCNLCKKIQLCSRCFDADKNLSGTKIHTCHSGEKNQLSEALVNDVTLDTKDKDDEMLVNNIFETRDAFLNKCQKSHFQFDTLSRAKYSSMMILYHLIHKPAIKPASLEEIPKQKPMMLKVVLDALIHASRCMNVPCVYSECRIIRRLFYHASRCSVRVRGGCAFCRRVWMILKQHSQVCRDLDCRIPRCMDIKKHKEMVAARTANITKDHQDVAQVAVG